jgi:hypothetical protein
MKLFITLFIIPFCITPNMQAILSPVNKETYVSTV